MRLISSIVILFALALVGCGNSPKSGVGMGTSRFAQDTLHLTVGFADDSGRRIIIDDVDTSTTLLPSTFFAFSPFGSRVPVTLAYRRSFTKVEHSLGEAEPDTLELTYPAAVLVSDSIPIASHAPILLVSEYFLQTHTQLRFQRESPTPPDSITLHAIQDASARQIDSVWMLYRLLPTGLVALVRFQPMHSERITSLAVLYNSAFSFEDIAEPYDPVDSVYQDDPDPTDTPLSVHVYAAFDSVGHLLIVRSPRSTGFAGLTLLTQQDRVLLSSELECRSRRVLFDAPRLLPTQ